MANTLWATPVARTHTVAAQDMSTPGAPLLVSGSLHETGPFREKRRSVIVESLFAKNQISFLQPVSCRWQMSDDTRS